MDAVHQESTAMGEESALEYKNMELEEGRSQWCREDTSFKNIKSTRSRCWHSNVCSIICVTLPLFLILVIMLSIKTNQQDSMLRELETKADNMTSSLHTLQSNLQQTEPHSQQPDYRELTEVKSAVTNLGASITSLSSKLHAEKEGSRMTVLEQSVINLTHSVNALSSGLQNTVSRHDLKLKGLETTIINMSSSLNTIISRLQQTVGQQEGRLMNLETKADNMASSLNSLSSKLQQTDEKLLTALTNLTAEIMSIKHSKDKITYSCTENWSLHATSCYLFSSNKLPWHKARDYCKTQRATLLIINNQDEWQFITKNRVPLYWIGLTDELNGEWRWVDGTPYVMDKSQWDAGQPDDWKDHGLGGGEDCGNFSINNRLNDDHCTREYKYICERTATAD
ncbi:asialoglycoprotein receptor 1-like isoform X4 [Alosa sapidissima]|uniref:asialoglycoprotein receptor 1-like isoform X4 n=1 Tax=Alosa sapidissima TaxID=34773 RepID=UPI001C0973E7|nr:asialoglycoprotein receptor 1-like isoform X4 [Alosa sapidissima]